MHVAIDSKDGRERYGQQLGVEEPVFGNIRHNKGLNRFTLRGPDQDRRPMEAVRAGAQHREAGEIQENGLRRGLRDRYDRFA